MTPSRSLVARGACAGLVGGLVFGVMEIVAAAAMDQPPVMPVRMFASVLLGRDALTTSSLGAIWAVGVAAHFAIAALWGLLFAGVARSLSPQARASVGGEAVLGLVWGTLVWLLNFHVIARIAYPWFLDTPQGLQWLLHALFYGLPVGLSYALQERALIGRPHVVA